MPSINETESVMRAIFPFILVIGVSSSISKERLEGINQFYETFLSELKCFKDECQEEIKIAVLVVDSEAKWITNDLEDIDLVKYENISPIGELNLGNAFNELYKKFSSSRFFSDGFYYQPYILFMLESLPSDDYLVSLSKVKKNYWFNRALKLGLSIGNDYSKETLLHFVDSDEAILEIGKDNLRDYIRFVDIQKLKEGPVIGYDNFRSNDIDNNIVKMETLRALEDCFQLDTILQLNSIFSQANTTTSLEEEKELQETLISVLQREMSAGGLSVWEVSPNGENHFVVNGSLCSLINIWGITILLENGLLWEKVLKIENYKWFVEDHLLVFDLYNTDNDNIQKCICHYGKNEPFVYFTRIEKVKRTMNDDIFDDNYEPFDW